MSETPSIDEDHLLAEVYAFLDGDAVGGKLRQGLRRVYGARERALRGPIPRRVPAHEFFQQQNSLYETKCEELLERGRQLLHAPVDRLIDGLFAQAVTGGGAALVAAAGWGDDDDPAAPRLLRSDASPPPSASKSLAVRSARLDPLDATAAEAAGGFTPVNGSGRLSRRWPSERKSPPAVASSAGGLRTALPSGSMGGKHRLSSEESLDETPKRSRRTSYGRTRRHHATSPPTGRTPARRTRYDDNPWPEQPPILLRDVKAGECVFRYPNADQDHFFVLRCTRRQCRPNREQMAAVDGILIFTAYPFRYKRAEKHFSGSGHRVDGDDDIFCTYAHEVTDAVEELNMEANKRTSKAQARMSEGGNVRDSAADGPEATVASPSSRPYRASAASASTSPRHPRSRAAAAAANMLTRPTTGTPTLSPAPRPGQQSSRSRSRSRSRRAGEEEAPPSDPSLLFTPDDDAEAKTDENKTSAENESKNDGDDHGRGFTHTRFAAPADEPDDAPEDDAKDSPYAPSSVEPSSLEQEAAAAIAVVQGHRQQQRAAAHDDDDEDNTAGAAAYATRARTGVHHEASEDLEDID